MIIKYKFVDGTISEVEVPEDIGEFITDSRRAEESAERYHHRYCLSINAKEFEGDEYGKEDAYFVEESLAKILELYDSLTDTQRRRLDLHAQDMTYREIAKLEGVNPSSVHESVKAAQKVFKDFL